MDWAKIFPNATQSQLKRLAEGTLTPDALVAAGGGTAASLKEAFPNATADQLKRLASGALAWDDLKKAGNTTSGKKDDAVGAPLKGGQIVRIRDGEIVRYYHMYEFPAGSGNLISYQYNSREQVEKIHGKEFDFVSHSQGWYDTKVMAEAEIEEVAGLDGNWTQYTNNLMVEAATRAGIKDPGLIGRMAENKEMQRIMAQAVIGGWTPEQIRAAQRNTKFWKQELYPGIENFYGATSEPERAWAEYRQSVLPALKALGYTPDANGTYNAQLKKMLNKKIDADVFLSQVPTFIKARQNADFARVLGQWANLELGDKGIGAVVNFNDWYNLMAGQSMPELEAVVEKAELAWAAQNAGTQVSESQIRDLSERTQLSAQQAAQLFSEFNTAVLALGDQGLAKYGLNRDEVLSASAGVSAASGRSPEEIKLLVAKTAREQALFDDEKINFYVGFSPQGTPNRPGLQTLAPEGA